MIMLRWKISAVFALTALLVSVGYPLLMLPTSNVDGALAFFSTETFFRFAALPTGCAAVISYVFSPKLIHNRARLLELVGWTALIILATHFVFCTILGLLAIFDSSATTNVSPLLGSIVFALMTLAIVGPAFVIVTALLPVFLRFVLLKEKTPS